MKKLSKSISLILLLVLIVGLFASCGNAGADKNASEAIAYTAHEKSYGYDYVSQDVDTEAVSENNPAEINNSSDRKLVKNGELSVQTKEFDAFLSLVDSKVKALGGYIEESSVNNNNDYYYSSSLKNAALTVRVPEEKFDEFLTAVSEMSNITSKAVSVTDITDSYIDTESRINALRAEQKALMNILEKADKVSDTIEVYSRISEVNAQIESLTRTIKSYDKMVAYSKIEIDVYEVEKITETEKEGFFAETFRRLKDNLYDIGVGLRNFAIGFISSLPYLLILFVIVFAVIIIIKKIIKKHKKKKAAKTVTEEKSE
ncbi:MAG: DUF4349 domain-containing protein [Clostridiales bacterium]|nr:DUF4349 domain-containing protein [Clostridiales bacterium]